MFRELWLRLKALLGRRSFDRDLEDEVAFHLAMREEKNRSLGGPQPAIEARRHFGNPTLAKEACREMRSFTLVETFWQDVRYGVRLLRKNPLFTLVAVVTLALGIGANTAIFSLVYQILLQRMPVPHPEELVILRSPGLHEGSTRSDGSADGASFSYPLYKDLREHNQVLASLLARFAVPLSVSAGGGAERAQGELVSGNYFDVLGVSPALGRVLASNDETPPGGNPVAVLSYGYWIRRYANDPSILNKQINVNGALLTVVGVAKTGFTGVQIGQSTDMFIPITMKPQITPSWNELQDRKSHWLAILGRMRPGMTVAASQSAMQVEFHQLLEFEVQLQQVPPKDQQQFLARQLLLDPGSHGRPILQRDAQEPLRFLMAMVGLVLLIACANLASLLIAKGEARQKEIAVRLSLGAGRRRVLRQLLTEGLMLALAGGAIGAAISSPLVRLILGLTRDSSLAGLTARLDWHMLLFALALSVATTLLFALLPALQLVRERPIHSMKEQGVGRTSSTRVRKGLIAGQVVLTTVLLASAGLFTQSLMNLKNVDLGLKIDHLVQFSISPALSGYSPEGTVEFMLRLRDRLAAQPGVVSVSAAEIPVLSNSTSTGALTVEGYSAGEDERMRCARNWVASDYFSTLKIPLLAGREFRDSDHRDGAKVAIVNQSLVRRYFGGQNALGKHIILKSGKTAKPDTEIVGIVADSKQADAREKIAPFTYEPIVAAEHPGFITFYIRTAQEPKAAMGMLRSIVAGMDSRLPITSMQTVGEQLDDTMLGERLTAYLCLAMGCLAALLAAMGLYGVMAYIVLRRTREIGIRMALGASRESIAWLVLKEVSRVTAVGLAIGLIIAVIAGRLVESQLFGVKGTSPVIFIITAALLLGVAAAAGSLPARRAARIEPVTALRYE
jgi:predicted permease